MILAIRTDNPEAEIGLFFDTGQKRQYKKWQAHRQLAESIHKEIDSLLKAENKGWKDISGIVCFKGPGSFTGLRIGLTVGNALAYSFGVPVVGESGEGWIDSGIKRISAGDDEKIAVPEYGRNPHITAQKK